MNFRIIFFTSLVICIPSWAMNKAKKQLQLPQNHIYKPVETQPQEQNEISQLSALYHYQQRAHKQKELIQPLLAASQEARFTEDYNLLESLAKQLQEFYYQTKTHLDNRENQDDSEERSSKAAKEVADRSSSSIDASLMQFFEKKYKDYIQSANNSGNDCFADFDITKIQNQSHLFVCLGKAIEAHSIMSLSISTFQMRLNYLRVFQKTLQDFLPPSKIKKEFSCVAQRIADISSKISRATAIKNELEKIIKDREPKAYRDLGSRLLELGMLTKHAVNHSAINLRNIRNNKEAVEQYKLLLQAHPLITTQFKTRLTKLYEEQEKVIKLLEDKSAADFADVPIETPKESQPAPAYLPKCTLEIEPFNKEQILQKLKAYKHHAAFTTNPDETIIFESDDMIETTEKFHFVSNSNNSVSLKSSTKNVLQSLKLANGIAFEDEDKELQEIPFASLSQMNSMSLYSNGKDFYLFNGANDKNNLYPVEQILAECRTCPVIKATIAPSGASQNQATDEK